MAKVIIKRSADKFSNKKDIRLKGKAGRKTRMFQKSRKIENLWQKAIVKPSKVDSVLSMVSTKKVIRDVTLPKKHYKQSHIPTATAKQKRCCGHRDLI
ncbi:hypothetical protein QJU23_01160 [Pasteurella atlantica]|uniref:Uncharacterized protein n=2 Tax=Pasteurellaceae TaxID=712 RepID=A0ACC6HJH2_9PAST|nr:hypothetical protein [Pasteurella atlantica]MDP8051030.1 hypothetical protein [Pasteurella atlantica]MDP8104326.1 hypothetical protein [Pasteurella atlantica]MDP8147686.1 hypothetical protein [Pasteurella atlantica]